MNKKYKLRAYWSKKEGDLILEHPLGIHTTSDGHLLYAILARHPDFPDRRVYEVLRERGYNPESLKFEIEIDFSDPKSQERFPTLYKEYQEDLKSQAQRGNLV